MAEKTVPLTNIMDVNHHGHILYIYDSLEGYIENLSSFILKGIQQGHQLIIVEKQNISKQIKKRVSDLLTEQQLVSVHFFDSYQIYGLYDNFNCDLVVDHYSTLIKALYDKRYTVRTWANVSWNKEENIMAKVEDYEKIADGCVRRSNLLSVCAYDGNEISATFQNRLLSTHEYFLTDHELVKSYLYKNSSVVFPSQTIQREHSKLKGKLKATKHQLQSFISQNLDPVVIIDKRDAVITVNEVFETTFGYTETEVVGLHVNELPIIPKERTYEVIFNRSFTVQGEKVRPYETTRRTRDGKELDVLLSCFPLFDEKMEVDGWAVIIRDISEKKQAQELLIKSEKLSIAGELAAGIAHEIRNPITSIKGFLQLMQSTNFEKQIYYEIMSSEIDRIEQILSELLMLAKPQAIHFAEKDLCVIIRDVITLLGPQASLNNVQIKVNLQVDHAIVLCEQNQIKQVCINFIKNAIDAMPNGGVLMIEVLFLSSHELLIRFIDQGIGISEELISKLGQPFYTTKEKGTGLGFMVSKRIVENHQGSVSIKSKVGKGTTIEVKLPT